VPGEKQNWICFECAKGSHCLNLGVIDLLNNHPAKIKKKKFSVETKSVQMQNISTFAK
jgi:hypothetical protein